VLLTCLDLPVVPRRARLLRGVMRRLPAAIGDEEAPRDGGSCSFCTPPAASHSYHFHISITALGLCSNEISSLHSLLVREGRQVINLQRNERVDALVSVLRCDAREAEAALRQRHLL